MDSAERLKLARDLTARLVAGHGPAIVVGGVFGSAARGDDTEWSDLDLLYVVRAGAALSRRSFLFGGVPVNIGVVAAADLEASLSGPDLGWPYWMGVLEALRVLAGDGSQIRRWQAMGRSVDDTTFRLALERLLPELVFESYGRIRSCAARGNQRDAAHAAIEVLYEMKTAICLLNRRWVTRDYFAGLEQSFGFPLLPDGWAELAPQLWDARELDEIVRLGGLLMGAYWRLLAARGVGLQNYQRVDQLPL